MEGPISGIVIALIFVTTNGQCPTKLGNSPLSSCEGTRKHGRAVYVDFYKINRPCTCIVTPLFDGDLLISASKIIHFACYTHVKVQNGFIFRCQVNTIPTVVFSVTVNQTVYVRAEYESPSSPETFYHCMAFQQNGGGNGNLSVTCGSPSEITTATATSSTTHTTTTTSTTTTITTSTLSSTSITPSIESTSVVITKTNTDVTKSSNTVNSSIDSLSMDSTEDDPNMIYIIAGSAAGGAILLVGLVILILISINRSRSGENKKRSSERGMSKNTNETFDSNAGLPDNPLYLSSQPLDELGYSSDQEKQLGLPPTDSKSKKKINPDYDVPPNNKPIYRGESSMPVYAVPKKSNEKTPEVSTGDVYAQVCKPNISTAQLPMRNCNEDGLLYMEVEQDRTSTDDKQGASEGVCYAEIKHP